MTYMLGTFLLTLVLSGPTWGFLSRSNGPDHVSISRMSLIQKVTETCRAVAEATGQDFKITVGWKLTNVHKHTHRQQTEKHTNT